MAGEHAFLPAVDGGRFQNLPYLPVFKPGGDHAEKEMRPATVRRIMDAEGREIYNYTQTTSETLAPELAYLLTDILADRETRCSLTDCPDTLELPGGHRAAFAAGESAAGDSWAVGYTPERLIGIRVSGDDATADPLWWALAWSSAGSEPADWPRPVTMRSVQVCEGSGLLPSPELGCPTVREWFIDGTEPVAFDTMARNVAVNRETGKLATIFTPPELIERRRFIVYPPEAAVWATEAGIESPPVEYDEIGHVPAKTRQIYRPHLPQLLLNWWFYLRRGAEIRNP